MAEPPEPLGQHTLQARLMHQEKMAAVGLLAAGIAHDMGNPLASIAMQLELIEEADLPAEVAEPLAIVHDEVGRLRRALRELVDFARRRRDEADLISVWAVVEDALRLLRHDPRMREVRLELDHDPEVPPVLMVEDHLMQVVLNLLLNALDALPAGGCLRITVGRSGDQISLRIHDNGQGMERAVLERCFEPLFTTKAAGRGTGLGLSICRDIARDAGGRIAIRSIPRCGTTAEVFLPAAATP